MAIKVIGSGFGRTGSLSLKIALEELGFSRCYHMTDVLSQPEHARIWDAAARGQPVDWDQLFEGYQATVDWPGCAFYEQLMRRYPDARVILSVRDPELWYESAKQTIYQVRRAFPAWLQLLMPRMRHFGSMVERVIWQGTFQGRFEDKRFAIDVFNRHNEQVRRVVPPDRLLVHQVQEGWDPLCKFLGVPVPDGKPFPHVNDAAEFRARIRRMSRIMRTVGYSFLGLVALILVLVTVKLLF
jgi:Sulfotransferase domain